MKWTIHSFTKPYFLSKETVSSSPVATGTIEGKTLQFESEEKIVYSTLSLEALEFRGQRNLNWRSILEMASFAS